MGNPIAREGSEVDEGFVTSAAVWVDAGLGSKRAGAFNVDEKSG